MIINHKTFIFMPLLLNILGIYGSFTGTHFCTSIPHLVLFCYCSFYGYRVMPLNRKMTDLLFSRSSFSFPCCFHPVGPSVHHKCFYMQLIIHFKWVIPQIFAYRFITRFCILFIAAVWWDHFLEVIASFHQKEFR